MRFLVGLVLLTLAGCSGTPAEDGAESSNDVAPLLRGRLVPVREIVRDLRAAGFAEEEIPQMVCAAKYESSFYAEAENRNRNGSTDYGLFQINDELWAGACGLSTAALYDPAKNARCARKVFKSGGIRSWYGYRRHESECARYVLP